MKVIEILMPTCRRWEATPQERQIIIKLGDTSEQTQIQYVTVFLSLTHTRYYNE